MAKEFKNNNLISELKVVYSRVNLSFFNRLQINFVIVNLELCLISCQMYILSLYIFLFLFLTTVYPSDVFTNVWIISFYEKCITIGEVNIPYNFNVSPEVRIHILPSTQFNIYKLYVYILLFVRVDLYKMISISRTFTPFYLYWKQK